MLLASRTSDIPGPHNRPTTERRVDGRARDGRSPSSSHAKTEVAVIGDITVYSPNPLPACLAAYPASIQTCSVNNPNGKTRQHFAAERAAATAEDVAYIPIRGPGCARRRAPR